MDTSIVLVLTILVSTVVFLVAEIVRIDVVAILCMLALGWAGILHPQEMLSGFSSNAVIAMMGVMIMGRGIAKTGAMDRFAHIVLKKAGNHRPKIIGFMSLSIGILSGFIQNIGAVALFLPGILNISRRGKIPASILIMPIGFAAILGGTISMVGSGPLILTNDLLHSAGLEPYGLFSVTPVGALLLFAGIVFMLVLGKSVLPVSQTAGDEKSEQEKLIEAFHLPHNIWPHVIAQGSPLANKTPEQLNLWDRYKINILAIIQGKDVVYAPWRGTMLEAGQAIALLGEEKNISRFAAEYGLTPAKRSDRFAGLLDAPNAGFAEVIVPTRSEMVGNTIRKYSFRKRYAVEPVMIFSKGEEWRGDFSDREISAGDAIIVYGPWDKISDLKSSIDFVVATPFQADKKDQSKTRIAILCFAFAVVLALTGHPISMAFFTGAVAMILMRVLSIQEAYHAIEWKVVFMLAGLIPLGVAMQKSGAAQFLAEKIMALAIDLHPILIILSVGILSTLFSLFMSNVGAIIVLAPLVVGMAQIGCLDPRPLVLMAAVCTSNSFILPTHQVNALLMSSGGYRNADYLKAGSGMTLIFLAIAVLFFYFLL
ncbi:MAG: anion permease [Acidobacteria bacterium]|nr:anion permease [Acidobacteriota bacterium]